MNFLRRFMYGRYGADQLNLFLLVLYLVLFFLSSITSWGIFYILSLAVMFLSFFRMLSRNIPKRQAENARFLHFFTPAARWLRTRRAILTDREHRYFKCPGCGQQLRVPRGKGRINITCRSCGVSFERKS